VKKMKIKVSYEDLEDLDGRNFTIEIDRKAFEDLFDLNADTLTLKDIQDQNIEDYICFDDNLINYNFEGFFLDSTNINLNFTK